jgi:tetraacyldisaccharide 4'-kinase
MRPPDVSPLERLRLVFSPGAAALEQGRFDGAAARACAAVWARVAERMVVRRLEFPVHTRIVTIGGATLGGSGKTPLAIACAAALAATGARVALVGHAYRAKPRRARLVAINDPLDEVGDEALVAGRALALAGVPVIVAPTRSAAIALAARHADVLVVDGVAQTRPVRSSLALLAVDSLEPWGHARALPPHGDLRAPEKALLSACDAVVAIADADEGVAMDDRCEPSVGVAWTHAFTTSSGVRVGETLRSWDHLAGSRLGLLCALARPERVVRSLERRGIAVRAFVRAPDHGPLDGCFFLRLARAQDEAGIDLWVATPKCAAHIARRVANVGEFLQGRLGAIEHQLVLSNSLTERLRALAVP